MSLSFPLWLKKSKVGLLSRVQSLIHLNVLKNNAGFYLAALDSRKPFSLSEMYVQITLYLQMSTGGAQDASTFSVQENVGHKYVHQS